MIEMTSEVRRRIDRASEKLEPRADEYIDPSDGLLHCKKCGGLRQTVIPNFGKPGYLMLRCICPCQMAAQRQRKETEAQRDRMDRIKRRKAQGL